MSRFYFGGDSNSISSSDDEDNLPYPEALPRGDFLTPDFDAPTYLSTLSDRHQTLEDLRTDLRERSQLLSKELLDLVNVKYEQFLSLGSDLKGGEEKVEDVRVGLLGFKRGVEDIKSKVQERGQEVDGLLKEKIDVTRQILIGRKLLDLDARLEDLEQKLMVVSLGRDADRVGEDVWSDSEDEAEDQEPDAFSGAGGTSAQKLQRLVDDYRQVIHIQSVIGLDHPFVVAQESRMMRIRNTILLDLATALKQAKAGGGVGSQRLIKILGIYRDMEEGPEALKILKDMKS
jgi:hypothetical protein